LEPPAGLTMHATLHSVDPTKMFTEKPAAMPATRYLPRYTSQEMPGARYQPLPNPSSCLPIVCRCLPDQASVVPNPSSCLPIVCRCLPDQAPVVPNPSSCLPIVCRCLPDQAPVVPNPQTLPSQSSHGASLPSQCCSNTPKSAYNPGSSATHSLLPTSPLPTRVL